MERLAKIAKEKGYSDNFVAFVGKSYQMWNEDAAIEAIENGKSEREILEIIFRPMRGDIFWTEEEREEDYQGCIQEGKDEYLARCDKDGNFQYDI